MTDKAYDRLRSPAPILPWRVPSGRRATEQPNATGDGEAALSLRFWTTLLVTGGAAGVMGVAMHELVHGVQRLAAAIDNHLMVLVGGGLLVGLCGQALRRWSKGTTDVDHYVWSGDGEIAWFRSLASSVLSEVAVGVGGSLGQEAAPKLLGAAAGSRLARWTGLAAPQRRLIVACGAGAGMGAIYNVPLGGALITAELLYGSLALPVVLPALICSAIATMTTWAFLGNVVTYAGVPTVSTTAALMFFAVLSGPLFGIIAVGFVRGIGWVSHHHLRGARSVFAPAVVFGLLGLLSTDLLGNGRRIVEIGFFASHSTAIWTLIGLALLKPLVTMACLWSGASGGLFTPVMATGACVGLLFGQLWSAAWPGTPLAAFALVGAAALSGAAMQAPMAATVLVLELTGNTAPILLPLVVATALATLCTRYLDGYSVYSARLAALESPQKR